jgi:glutamate-1-semialdehyde 2,1-aminomutase
MNYRERLLKVIPGGAHTYSRGFDQYPQNVPQILRNGKGVYVYDNEGREFLDFGMSLRAVNIGYAEESIDSAAIRQIRNGTNLTLPSMIELEAAELMVDLIDSIEMVKFTKNGSTAVTAAVKLARAYTGRNLVARPSEQPFFSYDDWFIGSTPITSGIPKDVQGKTLQFHYNDISSLERLIAENPGQIACVVLEPATFECPSLESAQNGCCSSKSCLRNYQNGGLNFLQQVEKLCKLNGIVFILDEMITGFRWDLKGAQYKYGVTPDLCTFGKAMANGYPLACVGGKREIMQLGSIEKKGQERVFLLSTTHGAEMVSLGAFIASVEFFKENDVINNIWHRGAELTSKLNARAEILGLGSNFVVSGPACSPYFTTKDADYNISLDYRTLFSQEMIKNGVLMPWIALAFRHGPAEIDYLEDAIDKSLKVYAKALHEGLENYLVGPSIQPVFRKFN